jgi:hypothetical protein
MSAAYTFLIPGDAADPVDHSKVGASLVMPYGVWGRIPRRSLDDVILSTQKHVAEVLDEVAGEWLTGFDPDSNEAVSSAWEVRLWDEQSAMHLPFARVAAVGPDTITARTPRYADHAQSMSVHLYPHPSQDSERAIFQADRLRGVLEDALEFGAGRTAGLGAIIPLWDFSGITDLYGDSAARHPSDYLRLAGLTLERFSDPEDDRYAWVVVNFRAQWRRAVSSDPGPVVQSVRMTAHPE